jgi:hypothetical protein
VFEDGGQEMAKPIRATPTLNQQEANEFVSRMIEVEKRKTPTKTEKFFIDAVCAGK